MNEHLSPEQCTDWILGERTEASRDHIQSCHVCRDAIFHLDETLAGFRRSARDWSADQMVRLPVSPKTMPVQRFPLFLTGGAGALAALFLLFVFVFRPVRPSLAPQQSISDADLLNQVNVALSHDVPDAMVPLSRLISYRETEGSSPSTETR